MHSVDRQSTSTADQKSANSDSLGQNPTNQSEGLVSTDIFLPEGRAAGDRSPMLFGDYEIFGEIARGGMGMVFKARQVKLDRVVALKMILPHQLSSESSIRRFYIEAEAAAKLDHPGIVAVHDVGVQDGRHYLCMSYVDGENLAARVKREPLSFVDAARIVRDVAQAVHYAHTHGIVHRDLKPANILLSRDGRTLVTDFGLARRMDSSEMPTIPGSVLGTPAFMSPEQADGRSDDIGPASDIYSLGAILYYLLTGQPPVEGTDPLDVLRRVRDEIPPRPEKLNSAIPNALAAICWNCLEKKPEDRFPTAHFLGDELSRFLNNEPLQATKALPRPTSVRTMSRKHVGIAASIGILGVLLAAAVYSMQGSQKPESNAQQGVVPPKSNVADAALPSLEGEILVRIWNEKQAGRLGVPITNGDALPLRKEDKIRIEATLNRPAYTYVVWIDTNGKASPVYPWNSEKGQWERIDIAESAKSELSLPQLPDGDTNERSKAWPVTGPAGMETVVLLARDTPLPKDVDLSRLLGGFERQIMKEPMKLVFLDHGKVVGDGHRAVKFDSPEALDDPVFETHRRITERLNPYFPLIRAVSIANEAVDKVE